MTLVGRRELDHPALAAAGGSGLHAAVELMWTTVSNDLPGRFFVETTIATSTTIVLEHNYGVDPAELTFLLYTGDHPNLTRVTNPSGSGWTIAPTGGHTKTQVSVTTPSSGGPFDFVIYALHAPVTSGSGSSVKKGTITSAGAQTFTHAYGAKAQSFFAHYFNGTTTELVDASSLVTDSRTNDFDVNVPSTFDFTGGKLIEIFAWSSSTVGSLT